MTMAYDCEPERDEAAPNGECLCKQIGAGRGRYIDDEGVRRFCYCNLGVYLKFKRDEFLRRQKEGM